MTFLLTIKQWNDVLEQALSSLIIEYLQLLFLITDDPVLFSDLLSEPGCLFKIFMLNTEMEV